MANAPRQTTTILGDQPITVGGERPTYWFVNFLQRLVSFVGQPATSGVTAGKTLSSSVTTLAETVTSLSAQIGASTSGNEEGHRALVLARQLQARPLDVARHLPPSVSIQVGAPSPPNVSIQVPVIARPTPATQQVTSVVTLANGARIMDGYGSPETKVAGSPGDQFLRRDGGAGTCLYIKETGANTNTGWVAK